MERFTAFPFSVGCVSHSSVKVVERQPPKKPRAESSSALTIQSNGKAKSSSLEGVTVVPLPKPNNIAAGIQKVIKSFKNLSYYLFLHFYNEEHEDDDGDKEMEIGFPTNVQHVGHIGWDGFNSGSAANMKSWNKDPDLLL